jgi:hypothetical protein
MRCSPPPGAAGRKGKVGQTGHILTGCIDTENAASFVQSLSLSPLNQNYYKSRFKKGLNPEGLQIEC